MTIKIAYLAAAILAAGVSVSASANAPQAGAMVRQPDASQANSANLHATEEMRERIAATGARITAARRGRQITSTRAATLTRRVAEVRRSADQLGRQQGFVSAGELASYNRTLGTIDVELDKSGVARSYGNDMLVSPTAK